MDLNTLWFVLVAVLFVGFFFLEGFDYGVGILMPFLGRTDQERRAVINSIGPFWDGNEVWLLTAGGAIFAAFPKWYSTLFSGFYLALVLMLLALIIRGVAFEYRSKHDAPGWRKFWDWAIFGGSLVPALLWGVAMTNIARGIAIGGDLYYEGTFLELLNPNALVGGLAAVVVFTLHGAAFLDLKLAGELRQRASAMVGAFAWAAVLLVTALGVYTFVLSGFAYGKFVSIILGWLSVLALAAAALLQPKGRSGLVFISTAVAIVAATASFFTGIFPNVMISSISPDWNLTIYNASSTAYTLKIMSIVAAIFVPIVLAYQGWTYWVFRKRVSADGPLTY